MTQTKHTESLRTILKNLLIGDRVQAADDLLASTHYLLKPIVRIIFKNLLMKSDMRKFKQAVADSDLQTIQNLFVNSYPALFDEYRELLSSDIKSSLKTIWQHIETDKEKMDAVLGILTSKEPHAIITARAGSGKTTLIGLLVYLLIEKFSVQPKHILTIAFNTDAAQEIGDRINDDYFKKHIFENYANFHQIAYALAPPQVGELVLDENKKTELLKKSFEKTIANNQALEKMTKHIGEYKTEMTDEEIYNLRYEQKQITLKGEYVKSNGEKWIADFLWKHNINYRYESSIWNYEDKKSIHPDFRLELGCKIWIWEHWAVTDATPNPSLPEWFGQTAEEYLADRKKKLKFYREKKYFTLSSCADDCLQGREEFEKMLYEKLASHKFPLREYSKEELVARFMKNKNPPILGLLDSYISRAKSNCWSPEMLAHKINQLDNSGEVSSFEELALLVFNAYEIEKSNGKTKYFDFSDMLTRAIESLTEYPNKRIARWKGRKLAAFSIAELKWIFIDEFQDFSPQFFQFISAIYAVNPSVRIIVVGDDWQAINHFAGASTNYFNNFKEYFPSSSNFTLLSNYRSAPSIVAFSNNFMEGNGIPSMAAKFGTAKIHHWFVDSNESVTLEARTKLRATEQYQKDRRFRYDIDESFILARYTKKLAEIIYKHWLGSPQEENPEDPEILVLFRNNEFRSYRLPSIEKKIFNILRDYFSSQEQFENNVKFTTAHKAKGLQASVVIVVGANGSDFPKTHPNEVLNRVFFGSNDEVMEQERNLFYVATTRAIETIHFLLERDCETIFLNHFEPIDESDDALPIDESISESDERKLESIENQLYY